MLEPTTLVTLSKTTIRRNGQPILQDVSFTLRFGECWAVLGPIGSGKTTFLQTLAGQLYTPAAVLRRQGHVEYVSFKEESSRFSYSNYFYQQRYQATMGDDPYGNNPGHTSIPRLRDFLQLTETPDALALVERLGLTSLLDRSLLKLSNGQTRKARIGRAILHQPSVLLLDNPFVGLDSTFRAELTDWLRQLVHQGLTLVFVTEPGELPAFVTHVVSFDKGQIRGMGVKENYVADDTNREEKRIPALQTAALVADFDEAFRLNDVTVQYAETVILDHINWVVRAGERWALFGPNGAGKSVLLSLLYGDHPQAYANDVRVFGRRRGKAGESIWDVKRRIGFVSPELHLYFPPGLPVRDVALTGLTDTLTPPRQVSAEAETDLSHLLDYFGLAHLLKQTFGTLSTGEQRLVLLIRALLKNPPLLLLDEPFQAIDETHVQLARRLIDSYADKTILFVSHNRYELPHCIDKLFRIGVDTYA